MAQALDAMRKVTNVSAVCRPCAVNGIDRRIYEWADRANTALTRNAAACSNGTPCRIQRALLLARLLAVSCSTQHSKPVSPTLQSSKCIATQSHQDWRSVRHKRCELYIQIKTVASPAIRFRNRLQLSRDNSRWYRSVTVSPCLGRFAKPSFS